MKKLAVILFLIMLSFPYTASAQVNWVNSLDPFWVGKSDGYFEVMVVGYH